MKKLIFMCAVVTLLTACGEGAKSESNLTGLWIRNISDNSSLKVFAKISPVDKDGNIYSCDPLAQKDIPAECTVHNGTALKVVSQNKACKTTGMGMLCIEYHTETRTLTIGNSRPFSKAQEQ